MPRQKKQHLKRRADGRYCCKFLGRQFLGWTEDEAFAKREEYKRQLEQEGAIRENPTVAQYAERWVKIAKAGAPMRTYNGAAIHLEQMMESIGGLYMKKVRPSDIKKVYADHYSSLSDSYVKHAKHLFSAMFHAAVEDGLISSNPVESDSASPPHGTKGSHRAITSEERELIETVAIKHPMHIAAIIMLYAGLRPQEVKALRMEDIDEKAGVIHVRSFAHVEKSNKYAESSTGKTKNATRDVPLFSPVIAAVKGKSGLILCKEDEIATPQMWRRSWESYCNAIEHHLNGCQRRWYGRTREHKAILAKGEKLPPWISFTVTPYDLRHSFASWCRDHGVELHTCAEWMGHRDATMVLRIYDEVSSKRSQAEAERLRKTVFRMQTGMQEKPEHPEVPENTPITEEKPAAS